jgi:hypothetical protein
MEIDDLFAKSDCASCRNTGLIGHEKLVKFKLDQIQTEIAAAKGRANEDDRREEEAGRALQRRTASGAETLRDLVKEPFDDEELQ